MTRKEEEPESSPEQEILKDKNIMVISGDEEMRALLVDILKSAGAKVDKEESAKRALEVLVSLKKTCKSTDLIIAFDIDVEDAEFLRKIKKTPRCDKISIIIIGETETEEKLAEVAATLSFPFELDALWGTLINALNASPGSCSTS